MSAQPALQLRLITEDTGKYAYPALAELVRGALRIIEPMADVSQGHVEITPPPREDEAWSAAKWHGWTAGTREGHRKRMALARHIATRLVANDHVVVHFDADLTWSRWARIRTCDTLAVFERQLIPLIRTHLAGLVPDDARRERLETRLVLWIPCGCIESWLYQATAGVARACGERHESAAHQALIASWAEDRTLLDEVLSPGDDPLGDCVGQTRNRELAHQFPHEDVYLAERSFHDAVEKLRASDGLAETLAGTTD